jgi:hypothetical protein
MMRVGSRNNSTKPPALAADSHKIDARRVRHSLSADPTNLRPIGLALVVLAPCRFPREPPQTGAGPMMMADLAALQSVPDPSPKVSIAPVAAIGVTAIRRLNLTQTGYMRLQT